MKCANAMCCLFQRVAFDAGNARAHAASSVRLDFEFCHAATGQAVESLRVFEQCGVPAVANGGNDFGGRARNRSSSADIPRGQRGER